MKHRGPVIAGIVGVALALLVLVLWPRGDDDATTGSASGSSLVGGLAPRIVGETTTGDGFDLDRHRGEWVVVNFFATWCPPCVEEHPELVRFSTEAAGRATVVSVAYEEAAETVEAFFAENGGDWPVLAKDPGNVSLDYEVKGLPESFLVDPEGRIVEKYLRAITADELLARIDEGATDRGADVGPGS